MRKTDSEENSNERDIEIIMLRQMERKGNFENFINERIIDPLICEGKWSISTYIIKNLEM